MQQLRAENLELGYGELKVVEDLSTSLPTAKITAIVGANGSGKSTLLKALCRVLRPFAGEVLLNEKSIHAMRTRDVARVLSILPQSTGAPDGLTVEDLVGYGRYPHRKLFSRDSDNDEMVQWAMEAASLQDLRGRMLNSLSGGQQQRVWIAMTLAQGAEILMLDEPTSHLDLSHKLEVMELLKQLNEQTAKTVVMVLHDLNLASRYASHMIVVRDGSIYAAGKPTEVMTPRTLMEAFGVQAEIIPDPRIGVPICVAYRALGTQDD